MMFDEESIIETLAIKKKVLIISRKNICRSIILHSLLAAKEFKEIDFFSCGYEINKALKITEELKNVLSSKGYHLIKDKQDDLIDYSVLIFDEVIVLDRNFIEQDKISARVWTQFNINELQNITEDEYLRILQEIENFIENTIGLIDEPTEVK